MKAFAECISYTQYETTIAISNWTQCNNTANTQLNNSIEEKQQKEKRNRFIQFDCSLCGFGERVWSPKHIVYELFQNNQYYSNIELILSRQHEFLQSI